MLRRHLWLPPSTELPMIIDAVEVQAGAEIPVDVCVIGAGAAGISLAIELSSSGLIVGVLEGGGLEFEDESQELYKAKVFGKMYPDPLYTRLRFFGGSTNHWAGHCAELAEDDFEPKPWLSVDGWPIRKSDLAQYYKKAKAYCGLSDVSFNVDYWKQKSGKQIISKQFPWLDTGVSINTLQTLFGDVYRPFLTSSETTLVFLHATVIAIEADGTATAIERVEVVSTHQDRRFSVKARAFVLACGGIENARLLLASKSVNERGLGNDYDLVGRYFMDHPVAKVAIFYPSNPAKVAQYLEFDPDAHGWFRISPSTMRQEGLAGARLPMIPVSRYYASEGIESFHILLNAVEAGTVPNDLTHHFWNVARDIDMVAEAIARKWFDASITSDADRRDVYLVDSMMEQLPDRANRISLSSERDRLGLPRVEIQWRLSEADKDSLWRSCELLGRGLGASGAGRLRVLGDQEGRTWDDLLNFGHHHMGTTRMHDDPRHGVVDRHLRVHGLHNLYVVGSSVFPTGGHVPPTLTIVALAVRLAEHLRATVNI